MKLVKIDDAWINPEKIVSMYETKSHRVVICFFEDEDTDFYTTWPIEKVLQAIEGSKEHLRIEGDAAKKVVSKKKNHLR